MSKEQKLSEKKSFQPIVITLQPRQRRMIREARKGNLYYRMLIVDALKFGKWL